MMTPQNRRRVRKNSNVIAGSRIKRKETGISKSPFLSFSALWLSLACIIMFIIQQIIGTSPFILDTGLMWQQPWRLLTSLFAHAGIAHLLFNIFSLALFGLILEGRIGAKRLYFVFFATGLLVNLLTPLTPYTRTLGASAAIFGIIGVLAILRPFFVIWLNFFPLPMILAAAVWMVQDVLGIFYPNNVAHISHIMGLAIGIVIGFYYRNAGFGDRLRFNLRGENKSDYMHPASEYFRNKDLDSDLDNFEKRNKLR